MKVFTLDMYEMHLLLYKTSIIKYERKKAEDR